MTISDHYTRSAHRLALKLAVFLSASTFPGTACAQSPPTDRIRPVVDSSPRLDSAIVAEGHCVIARIVDGDTVRCADGTRVRLLLIDAPEMDQGAFGGLAKAALDSLLPLGTTASLHYDLQRFDRYGRTLAYIFLSDGRMANEELVAAGYAVVSVYQPNVRYVERMRRSAAEAREGKRGLHARSAFDCLPADHRRGRCD